MTTAHVIDTEVSPAELRMVLASARWADDPAESGRQYGARLAGGMGAVAGMLAAAVWTLDLCLLVGQRGSW